MKRPVFLQPQTYRQRRLRDAARLLPVLATFLFVLPMLWGDDDTAMRRTGIDAIYLFAAWLLLIIAAWALARRLMPGEAPPAKDRR
jgi:hypothetical protein